MKIKNVSEINNFNDLYLILEGDWGGQIYLTLPLKLVKIDKRQIIDILFYLDNLAWPFNENQGCQFYIEL